MGAKCFECSWEPPWQSSKARIEEIIVIVYFVLGEVKELGIMVEIAVFKGGFAPGIILQSAVGSEPRDTVNHRYHVARFVRRIGNASMPEAHIPNERAPLSSHCHG